MTEDSHEIRVNRLRGCLHQALQRFRRM